MPFELSINIRQIIEWALDVILLAYIVYQCIRISRHIQTTQIISYLVNILLIYVIAAVLRLYTILWLFHTVFPWFVICLIVIFQPELRSILIRFIPYKIRATRPGVSTRETEEVEISLSILVQKRRGCLIVFVRSLPVTEIVRSGIRINADVKSELITTIFEHNTHLHDGAIVIEGDRITLARCLLPLTEKPQFVQGEIFGTRHNAAVGLSEQSDAVVLVVSEERGTVSLAVDGHLHYDIEIAQACRKVYDLVVESKSRKNKGQSSTIKSSTSEAEKLIAKGEKASE